MEQREFQVKVIVTCVFGFMACYVAALAKTYMELM
tara:strand:+ start:3267 stop:3371 length:105 start_codon:yes stop_codon:yes gene_type:complete